MIKKTCTTTFKINLYFEEEMKSLETCHYPRLFSIKKDKRGDVRNIQENTDLNLTIVYLVLGHSIDSLKYYACITYYICNE